MANSVLQSKSLELKTEGPRTLGARIFFFFARNSLCEPLNTFFKHKFKLGTAWPLFVFFINRRIRPAWLISVLSKDKLGQLALDNSATGYRFDQKVGGGGGGLRKNVLGDLSEHIILHFQAWKDLASTDGWGIRPGEVQHPSGPSPLMAVECLTLVQNLFSASSVHRKM